MENNHTKQLEFLQSLGLDERQGQIYLAALSTGGGTITELARAGQIERSGIYYHIDKLIGIGLLRTASRGQRTIYLPADPQQLKVLLSQKQEDLSKILPLMQDQFSREISKSIVEYYRGIEEADRFYDRLYDILKNLTKPGNEIMVLGQSYRQVSDVSERLEHYKKQPEKIDIKTRAVLAKSQKSKDPGENKKDPYIVTRFNLPEAEIKYLDDKYVYSAALIIMQDKIISLDPTNFFYSITENKVMAATWRMFFEFIWEHLEKR